MYLIEKGADINMKNKEPNIGKKVSRKKDL